MKFWIRIFSSLPMALLAIGCATRTLPDAVPQSHLIRNVPFILQEQGHCGPATLTMVLNTWGRPVQVQQMVDQVYTPKAQGSFQMDMIAAARRQGMLAIPISGINSLLAEIASDHPVIVFENLGISWYPLWHYAVVYGYDFPKKEFILHSGKDQADRETFRVFENSWKLADDWGLVILPPNRLSATANELDHVRAASALEQLGLFDEANQAYETILHRWPQSLGALIGRANIAYTKNRLGEAHEYLALATSAHPHSAAAWHNLAITQKAQRKKMMAKRSALRAIEFAHETQKQEFKKSLKEILN